ncbi:hypothetical protein LINPERHAP1_LOCUS32889 [Linum perenne]
MASSYTK